MYCMYPLAIIMFRIANIRITNSKMTPCTLPVCACMCTHIYMHCASLTEILSFLTQWGTTALLISAYIGSVNLVRMLLEEFDCSLDEVNTVSV